MANQNYVMTEQEFNEFSLEVFKTSIYAVLIPIAAGIIGYFVDQAPWFWFFVSAITMALAYVWTYRGPKTRNAFIVLLAFGVVVFAIIHVGFALGEHVNAKYPSPAVMTEVEDAV